MKRLIACSDGTWNTREKFGGDAAVTNVVKMARAVAPRAPDGTVQVVFYDEGVGTGLGFLGRVVGGALGIGLGKNVGDAYQFLVDNYEPGDDIFLFGFSRGAYTARSLAGLIRKCGLLRKEEAHRFPDAYDFYRGDDHPNSEPAVAFRARHAREVPIRFLGVWDTVGALGIPWSPLRAVTAHRHEFHDVELSGIVQNAYHALAIDERRKHFEPALWGTKPKPGQTVEQVWFAGTHSGVGGGYPDTGLSDLAFQWMMEKAEAEGLAFDAKYVQRWIRPDFRGPIFESRQGMWRFVPALARPIGDPEHRPQSLHPSVWARHKDPSLGYAPQNLVEHLERAPSSRVGA